MNRFSAETGIREHQWKGRYWARWNDALAEAGFAPNRMQQAYSDDVVMEGLIEEIRRRGRMPTEAELNLRRREDSTFPSTHVFRRIGPRRAVVQKIADFCRDGTDYADVLALLEPLLADAQPEQATHGDDAQRDGFVYLLKSGRFYKIGRTLDVGRRRYDLAIQLPEAVTEEHVVRTDDPAGIEAYWHRRFGERRKNGEWFELTRADIAAFKRRTFM